MELRTLSFDDVEAMWTINEQGLPGTGQVSRQELRDLLTLSILPVGAFQEEKCSDSSFVYLPEQPMVVSIMHGSMNDLIRSFMLIE